MVLLLWQRGAFVQRLSVEGDVNKPHVHAALIKAWADGSEIECCEPGISIWGPMEPLVWLPNMHYRIKPPPPNYGEIASTGWYSQPWPEGGTVADRWNTAASAVINAYKKENGIE